ncbi:BLUF domain-containing protein [Variovorax ginsengisoli]|uniref:BLUF domain-containing protein n=2 Tax=Variovorax guangxiensis TaxID=1775474 RepID=A0A502DTV1_9BURK|nr:BLUF domain-containing protein [Variovorax ginsengisoli]TPG27626.1 BLUF domain-containing protein [Variovorax guangxiensis]
MRRRRLDCRMLQRLVYASHASATGSEDVAAILDWSRRVNPDLGVTGVLCLLDGVYMQCLEGEAQMIDLLFASIRVDRRHRDVTPLQRRAVPRRMFESWSMALLGWNDTTRDIFRSFSPGRKLDLYANDPTTAAPMLRALVRAPGWKLALD